MHRVPQTAGMSVKWMKEYIVKAIAQETINSFDAHNAPELIRCKDCRFYWGNGFCNRSGIHLEVNDDWFCADGVRKDADRSEDQPDE